MSLHIYKFCQFYFKNISDTQSNIYISLFLYWISKTHICPDPMVLSCLSVDYVIPAEEYELQRSRDLFCAPFPHHLELFLTQSNCLMLKHKKSFVH